MPDVFSLLIPSFIAGVLTFLAPCTLPLVPAYLGFISGSSAKDFQDPALRPRIRRQAFVGGLFYALGFSVVFIGLGLLFGIGGTVLGEFRSILEKVGGTLIAFFGLYLIGVFNKVPFFQKLFSKEYRVRIPKLFKSGSVMSAFLFGATFALGWTPCVGPILGSVLLLASTTSTVWQGAFLLMVFFSVLAVPFLLLALGIGHATQTVRRLSVVLPYVSFVGGVLLVVLGVMLLTGTLSFWLQWSYGFLSIFPYDRLLDYL